ncbi:MAG: STAS domain-containing protein [Acidobacteriia bacterium]|nr:STAS domain-containing protein [Terriglobia bacterium]
MEISASEQAGCLVVLVAGRLDTDTAPEFERYCTAAIEKGHRKFALDLSRLEFISSAGFRAILGTAKRLKPSGGAVAACSLSGVVAEVFAISGFANLMPITPDVPSAIQAL